MSEKQPAWWFFNGTPQKKKSDINERLTKVTPPWRKFEEPSDRAHYRGDTFVMDPEDKDDRRTLDLINAALYLHRPMLIKGETGVGKSSLAYAIATEFDLGEVIYWPITSHTSIREGLYRYDIIRHLQNLDTQQPKEKNSKNIKSKNENEEDNEEDNAGRYFALKQLGSALASENRRVLLIDELDKADMDLPNDLLHVLEEGKFQIDELVHHNPGGQIKSSPSVYLDNGDKVDIHKGGWIFCKSFPIIIITSNLEREFTPAFIRRCITIELKKPEEKKLQTIVKRHFKLTSLDEKIEKLIADFSKEPRKLATDKLLSAVHMYLQSKQRSNNADEESLTSLINSILLDKENIKG